MTAVRLIILSLCGVAVLRAADYVGPDACTSCHSAEAAKQSASHHAQALRRISGSTVGNMLLQKAQSPDGLLHYSADAGNVIVSGPWTGESPVIEWAFGAGAQGSTPVGKLGDQYFEHRFSYYSRIDALAPTFGHPRRVPPSLAALGILQDSQTITSCFNCHGTGVKHGANGPDLSDFSPGVRCERCHGPGSAHIDAATHGKPAEAIDREIVNPGRLPAKSLIEICGQCHRLPTAEMGSEPELENRVTVRLAPIGLLASRCFTGSKGKLSCLTCHNPHENAQPRTSVTYTEKCLECHANSRAPIKLCRRHQRENCLTCHMQQTALTSNLRFTDHRIRVYMSDAE